MRLSPPHHLLQSHLVLLQWRGRTANKFSMGCAGGACWLAFSASMARTNSSALVAEHNSCCSAVPADICVTARVQGRGQGQECS